MNTYRIYTSMDRTNFIEQEADTIGFDHNSGALVGYAPESGLVTSQRDAVTKDLLWFHPAGFGFTIVAENQGKVYQQGILQGSE